MTYANKRATNSNKLPAKYQDQNEAQSRAGIPWRNAEAGVGLEKANPVERQ